MALDVIANGFGIVKPEYWGIVERVRAQFDRRLADERASKGNTGKYLVGSSQKPFDEMNFRIVKSKREYVGMKNGENEILVGEKI